MTNIVVLTPWRLDRTAVDLGNRVWRKQLLPLGPIKYRGREITFDKAYLTELVRSWTDKAFDQIPFQLAEGDNKHTNNPERYRGDVVGVELTESGLDILLQPTEEGEKLLADNPKLGVSARIYENYTREADGKHWRAALQHVLGTLDPRVTGMKPWEAVASLSNQINDEIINLTTAVYGKEETVGFTDEDRGALRGLLRKMRDAGTNLSDDELDALINEAESEGDFDEGELTDAELDALIGSAEAEYEGESEDEGVEYEDEEIAASQEDFAALELANATIAEQGDELLRVSSALDASAFEKEQLTFANRYGIPPFITELARPLMEGRGKIVELAGGDTVDAGQVVRNVLTAIGQQVKMLDLSDLLGNGLEPDEDKQERDQEVQETEDFVKNARAQFGL